MGWSDDDHNAERAAEDRFLGGDFIAAIGFLMVQSQSAVIVFPNSISAFSYDLV